MKLAANSGPLHISTTPDGVVMVGGQGDISLVDLYSALELAWSFRSRRGGDYLAVVVDFRRLRMRESWPVSVPSVVSSTRDTAGAMVVRRDQLERALECCMVYASAGAVMGAFTSEAEALDWAVSRTLALQSQRAMRQRRSLATLLRRLDGEDQGLGSGQAPAQDLEPMD